VLGDSTISHRAEIIWEKKASSRMASPPLEGWKKEEGGKISKCQVETKGGKSPDDLISSGGAVRAL
jgi:hypothetical protein